MSNSFFDKLKNKVTYKLNEAVEDPAAQKYAEENKKEEDKFEPPAPANDDFSKLKTFVEENKEAVTNELLPKVQEYIDRYGKRPNVDVNKERDRLNGILMKTIIETGSFDEVSWALDDEIEKSESENPNQFNYKNIPKQVWRNIKRYGPIVFFPLVALILASIVANDCIIYPPQVRLAFFLITLIVCLLSKGILTMVALFYIGKKIYDYYINEMSENPKRLIMPTMFAFLPLITHEHPNRFLNGLARPFKYGENYIKRDGPELKKRMEMYQKELDDAFPYLETIKTKDPFKGRLDKIKSNFENLHSAMAPPVTSTLPPVIRGQPPVTSTLPPVIRGQPPVTRTRPAVTNNLPPVIGIQQPVAETQPPVTGTEQPVTGTEPPVTGTEQPVTGTEQPVTGTEQPVTGTEQVSAPPAYPSTEESDINKAYSQRMIKPSKPVLYAPGPAQSQQSSEEVKAAEGISQIPQDVRLQPTK
jgi:hypothetical protein